jgi:hypothetical protein
VTDKLVYLGGVSIPDADVTYGVLAGSPGSPLTFTPRDLTADGFVMPLALPLQLNQPPPGPSLYTYLALISNAIWQRNRLWIVMNSRCIPTGQTDPGTPSCVRVIKLRTSGTGPPARLAGRPR